jgi:hypothetical protein
MTKKYTVVYSVRVGNCAYNSTITRFKHIETDSLKEVLEKDDDFGCNVWWVFDGHLEPTKD